MQSSVQNVGIVVGGLGEAATLVKKGALVGVVEALQRALELSRGMINETDHSLADLAKMGHPYGNKHPAVIHDPDEIVHAQTGDYINALRVAKPRMYADAAIVEGDVHIDDSMAELDTFIQTGTTKMRARPWMQYIVDNHGDELAQIVADQILNAMEFDV